MLQSVAGLFGELSDKGHSLVVCFISRQLQELMEESIDIAEIGKYLLYSLFPLRGEDYAVSIVFIHKTVI